MRFCQLADKKEANSTWQDQDDYIPIFQTSLDEFSSSF